jgi:hypothetical protein
MSAMLTLIAPRLILISLSGCDFDPRLRVDDNGDELRVLQSRTIATPPSEETWSEFDLQG